jgi:dihydrofolate reductase
MGKLILQMQMSVDGFVGAAGSEHWQLWEWGDNCPWDHELKQDFNAVFAGIDTILLISEPEYAAISSSMVRELAHFGKDISKYLPTPPKNNN